MRVRQRGAADLAAVRAFLAERHSARVARLGELLHPLEHPALVAEEPEGTLAGVLTYVLAGRDCEILTLHAARRWRGAGTALVAELELDKPLGGGRYSPARWTSGSSG